MKVTVTIFFQSGILNWIIRVKTNVYLKDHGPLDGDAGLPDGHVHGEVEQLRVPMLHPAEPKNI